MRASATRSLALASLAVLAGCGGGGSPLPSAVATPASFGSGQVTVGEAAPNPAPLQTVRERVEALHTLERFDDGTALAQLESALNDPEPEVRIAALDGLSDRPDLRAVQAMGTALFDQDLTVREEALFALAGSNQPAAQDWMVLATQDEDAGIRQISALLLAALAERPEETLTSGD